MDCSYLSNCGVVPFLLHVLLYCYVVIQISSCAFQLFSYIVHALIDYIESLTNTITLIVVCGHFCSGWSITKSRWGARSCNCTFSF